MIIGPSGKFLKSDEVKEMDIITIKDAGTTQPSTKFSVTLPDGTKKPKTDYIFKVELRGEDRIMTMNKGSRDNLAQGYGSDTDKWVGKTAQISICKLPTGKNMILLFPVKEME